MSRPTRTEILKAVDPSVIFQAARAYAAIAPDTCPECEGKGKVPQPVNTERDSFWRDCESCGGSGYVWPDNLRQNLEWVLTVNAPLMSQRMKDAIVVGLLDVLVEVDDSE